MALSRTLQVILSGDSKKLDKSLTKAEKRLAKFQKVAKLAAVGAASLAGVMAVKSVNAAIAYEEALSKLESQLGLTKPAVAAIGDEVNALSRKVAISNVELAGAAFAIQSAGLRGKEAGQALEVAGKLAASGLGEARAIGLTTAAAITAYGSANLSAAEAGDVLIATVKEGNLEASELASSLGQALPISSALGVSFAEVGASIAHYTRLGVSAGQATTGVRAAMQSLLSPSRTAQEGLQALGLQATDLKLLVDEHGLVGALDILRSRLGNDVAFSKFIGSTEALSFALAVTGKNAEGFEKTLEGVTNSAGATEEAFDAASQTTAFAMRQLRENFNVLATQLGTLVLPAVKSALDAVTRLVDMFQNLNAVLGDTERRSGELATVTEDLGITKKQLANALFLAEEKGIALSEAIFELTGKVNDVGGAAVDATDDMEALRSKASEMPSVLAALATDAHLAEVAIDNVGLSIFDATRQMSDGKKELIAYGAAAQIMGLFFNGVPNIEQAIADIQGSAVRAIADLSQGLGSADTQSRIAGAIMDASSSTGGITRYTSTRRTTGPPVTPTVPRTGTSRTTSRSTDDEAKPDTIDPARMDRAQFLGSVLARFAKYGSDFTTEHFTEILAAYQDDQTLLNNDALAYYGRAETDAQATIDRIAGGFDALIAKADLDADFTKRYNEALVEAANIASERAHQDALDQLDQLAKTEAHEIALNRVIGRGVRLGASPALLEALRSAFNEDSIATALAQSQFTAMTGYTSRVDMLLSNFQDSLRKTPATEWKVPGTGPLIRVGGGANRPGYVDGRGEGNTSLAAGSRSNAAGGHTYYVTFNIDAPGGDPEVIADTIWPALQQLESRGTIIRISQ